MGPVLADLCLREYSAQALGCSRFPRGDVGSGIRFARNEPSRVAFSLCMHGSRERAGCRADSIVRWGAHGIDCVAA